MKQNVFYDRSYNIAPFVILPLLSYGSSMYLFVVEVFRFKFARDVFSDLEIPNRTLQGMILYRGPNWIENVFRYLLHVKLTGTIPQAKKDTGE